MIFSSFHEIIIFPMEFPGVSYVFPVALHAALLRIALGEARWLGVFTQDGHQTMTSRSEPAWFNQPV